MHYEGTWMNPELVQLHTSPDVEWKKLIGQIICATFNDILSTAIITCFSPTNTSHELDIKNLYQRLYFVARHIPKHNVLIVGEDMNS